ncbi:MAG: hypothetical protein U0T68_14480 [Ferruginibacter sp.]
MPQVYSLVLLLQDIGALLQQQITSYRTGFRKSNADDITGQKCSGQFR